MSLWCILYLFVFSDNHDIISMKFYELDAEEEEGGEGEDYSKIVPRAQDAEGERGNPIFRSNSDLFFIACAKRCTLSQTRLLEGRTLNFLYCQHLNVEC